jgi:SAM-dependent methyltransferase
MGRVPAKGKVAKLPSNFVCNICGSACRSEVLDRELPSCDKCGSNVRFRWIVHALSTEIFGESLLLKKFPKRKKIRGIGMSDSPQIADVLSSRFDYTNTSYHREPKFDITAPPQDDRGFDFIVASEVFEHVQPPVQDAFNNLAGLLSPAGFAIFSSPWELRGDTVEHFPGLNDWQVVHLRTGSVLLNRTAGGKLETFEDLNFHEGPGSTVEMRVFSRSGLLANCAAAGFARTSIAEDFPAFGIVWEAWSRGLVLRK